MMDKDYLYQIDIREWIERGLDADIMVPVSGNKIDKKYDIYLQSFLLPLNEVENDMENDTYNAHTLMPGITVYGSWEDDEKVYHRWGNDNGYEPLVIKREYNGVATDSIEIVEEFRLLFNLYFNSQKNEYIDVSNGEGITVVKMNDNGYVTIHKRYLKTYLAVKEKVLMIHIDSRCVSIDNSEKIKEDGLVYRNSENTIFYALNIGNTSTGLKRKNYSIIYAKNVVSGCSLCDSNIWPYNEEKTYVDFIIGIDENGKEIRHTCNPKELNNYFGANPTAPHYLTPVYFDSAVLNKYYSKPEIYKVEDGIIRCGVLWSLYIDNSNSDYVSAYLGDLGRDLPSEAEQHYWRGFNKSIGGKLSKTKIKRDFMCIASDSESPDFVFKKAYTRLNRVFTEKYGWPLFLSLTEQDDMCVKLVAHRLTSLALKKQMKFEKRKLQDFPQYEFSYNNNTLKRVSNENKDRRENFIIKPVDGERGSITFFDFTDYETFSCTKMGVLYDILNALHDEFGKYIRVKFKQYSIDEVLEYKRASLELYKDIVKKEVLNSGINIVDAVHTETSEDYLQDVADGINKIIPEAKCSVGKRLSKKKLNVRYIHDKSFYSDSEVDPHQESIPLRLNRP